MSLSRALIIVAVASSALAAQGRGNAKGKAEKPNAAKVVVVREKYTDNDRRSDARVITTWYNAHPDQRAGGNGRGRARGHAFAPGWQKKLARDGIVPVEYRTYIRPAPPALIQVLQPVRPTWNFMVAENRVLLIEQPTWKIIDVVVP
jgi:hypothetical protein